MREFSFPCAFLLAYFGSFFQHQFRGKKDANMDNDLSLIFGV